MVSLCVFLQELDLLGEEDAVFKLTGPVLMKVEMADAKHNVSKRLEMIEAEIKRVDDKIAAVQGEQTALGDVVCHALHFNCILCFNF